MASSMNASPRVPRQAALSDDMDFEDKHMFPPSRRSHLGSPLFARKSASSVASSVEHSPTAPSNGKTFTHSPVKSRRSEPELLDAYPRFEPKKKLSADFSDDTMSVGSIGGGGGLESPKASDRSSWRLRSAVAGPFLTGPLAKDFQTEHLKTPRGKAPTDMSSFDHSGLLFPLAPVLDVIPDTPRGGGAYPPHQTRGFTDIRQFEHSAAQSIDGFDLDSAGSYAPRRTTTNNSQLYTAQQPHQSYISGSSQQSSALVATHANSSSSSSNAHAPSYADVVARSSNSTTNTNEQSLVAAAANDGSLESLSKGMADSMAQILAKTQHGRSFNEVQLTTLVQKIHMHMSVMGRTSAAIRDDYNRIKATLEQTITDKKVLEATNFHLQTLVQQYEVERQYFHQYVLHSLQSQSTLLYESMGSLSQTVGQSKHTIDELGARLSRELTSLQSSGGAGRSDSQLKAILDDIKRAVDASAIAHQQQLQMQQQSTNSVETQHQHAPTGSPHAAAATATTTTSDSTPVATKASSGFKVVLVLLAVLLWGATLGGVYLTAKSAALSELQTQQQTQPSAAATATSMLPSDLDRIVDQIALKLESAAQASEVRKLVYSELTEHPQLVAADSSATSADVVNDDDATIASQSSALSEVTTTQAGAVGSNDDVAPVNPSRDASGSVDDAHVVARDNVQDVPVVDVNTVEVVSLPAETVDDARADADMDAKTVEPEAAVDDAASVPADDSSSDNTLAPAPMPDAKPEVVEIAVPPVEPFQVTDEAIAEMLRLNGFPAGVLPFDGASSTVGTADVDVVQPSVDEPAVADVDTVVDTVTPVDTSARAPVVEPEVVAPTTTDRDVVHDTDASAAAADVVEITIESALNPEVIVAGSESPASASATATATANATANATAVEPNALDDVIVIDPPVDTAGDNASASTTSLDAVVADDDESPVSVDLHAEPTADVSSDVDMPTPTSRQAVAEPIADDESTVHIDNVEPTDSVSEPVAVAAVSVSASVAPVSVDNASVQETAGDATAADDSSVSAVFEKFASSAPFTGLSMALRSLAHRFVESIDASKAPAGDSFAAASEPLPVVDDSAQRLEAETSDDEAETVNDKVAPVVDAAESVDVAVEAPTDDAESEDASDAAVSIESEQSVDDVVSEPSMDAVESDAVDASAADQFATVEVTADGDVAESADSLVAVADDSSSEATDIAVDASFPTISAIQDSEYVAADEVQIAAADATDDELVEDVATIDPTMTLLDASDSVSDTTVEVVDSNEQLEDAASSSSSSSTDAVAAVALPELPDATAASDVQSDSLDEAVAASIVSGFELFAASLVGSFGATTADEPSAFDASKDGAVAEPVDAQVSEDAVTEPADALESVDMTAEVADVSEPSVYGGADSRTDAAADAFVDAQPIAASDTDRVLESVASDTSAVDVDVVATVPSVAPEATSVSDSASDADTLDVATDDKSIVDTSGSASEPSVELDDTASTTDDDTTVDDGEHVDTIALLTTTMDAPARHNVADDEDDIKTVDESAADPTVETSATTTPVLALDDATDAVSFDAAVDSVDDVVAIGSSPSTPSDASGSVDAVAAASESPSIGDDDDTLTTRSVASAADGDVSATVELETAAAASDSVASDVVNDDDSAPVSTSTAAVDAAVTTSPVETSTTLLDDDNTVDATPATVSVQDAVARDAIPVDEPVALAATGVSSGVATVTDATQDSKDTSTDKHEVPRSSAVGSHEV